MWTPEQWEVFFNLPLEDQREAWSYWHSKDVEPYLRLKFEEDPLLRALIAR